jgi:hypothetical protein
VPPAHASSRARIVPQHSAMSSPPCTRSPVSLIYGPSRQSV